MGILFKVIGAVGLSMIIIGILVKPKRRRARDILYAIGGAFLTAYSIYIRDVIFIILQVVFVAATMYDLFKYRSSKIRSMAKNPSNNSQDPKEKAEQIELVYQDFLRKLGELKAEQDKIIKDFVESIREEKLKHLKENIKSKLKS